MSLDEKVSKVLVSRSNDEKGLSENCLLGQSTRSARVRERLLALLQNEDSFVSPSPLDFVSDLFETLGRISPDSNAAEEVAEEWRRLKVLILSANLSPDHHQPLVRLLESLSSGLLSAFPVSLVSCDEIDQLVNGLTSGETSSWIGALKEVVTEGRVQRDTDFYFLREMPTVDWKHSLQELQNFVTNDKPIVERRNEKQAELETPESCETVRLCPREGSCPAVSFLDHHVCEALAAEVEGCKDAISSELVAALSICLSVSPTGKLILTALRVVDRAKRTDFGGPRSLSSHHFAPFDDHLLLRSLLRLAMHETSAGVTLPPATSTAIIRQLHQLVVLPDTRMDTETETSQSLQLLSIIPRIASEWSVGPDSIKTNTHHRLLSLQIMADCLSYVQAISNVQPSQAANNKPLLCTH